MIGDRITYHPELKPVAMAIIKEIDKLLQSGSKFCIAIAGESGCGKSTLASALKTEIDAVFNLKGYIFQMDDYFKLPPKDNHEAREQNIANVGPHEVNLTLLNAHISAFKKGESIIEKPLVDYYKNTIGLETANLSGAHYCIAEGTYTCLMSEIDCKLFMEVNYKDTEVFRRKRNRDIMSSFNDKVLAIEHEIIKTHNALADIIIDKNLKIRTKT